MTLLCLINTRLCYSIPATSKTGGGGNETGYEETCNDVQRMRDCCQGNWSETDCQTDSRDEQHSTL